jgi:hypothetical protein
MTISSCCVVSKVKVKDRRNSLLYYWRTVLYINVFDHIKDVDCWLRQSCIICLINSLFKVVIDVLFLLACASLISRIHLHSANMTNYFLCIFQLLMMIHQFMVTSVNFPVTFWIPSHEFHFNVCYSVFVFGLYCSGTTTIEESVFILVHTKS